MHVIVAVHRLTPAWDPHDRVSNALGSEVLDLHTGVVVGANGPTKGSSKA